jgi:hypothetical protein
LQAAKKIKKIKMNKFMLQAKALSLAVMATVVGISLPSCSNEEDLLPQSVNTRAIKTVITVSGVINSNTTWSSNRMEVMWAKARITSVFTEKEC